MLGAALRCGFELELSEGMEGEECLVIAEDMIPGLMSKLKKGYFVKGKFVAEGSELDLEFKRELKGTDDKSRTDLKRESTELQKLGEDLLTLRADLLARLDLPEKLLEALAEYKRITNFEGRRRLLQFIGKRMRQLTPETLDKIYVKSTTGQMVPLRAFAKLRTVTAPLSIIHEGQFPAVTLSFNLSPGSSLGNAIDSIQKITQRSVEKGRLAADARTALLGRISVATDLDLGARDIDLCIEAVPEVMSLKVELLGRIVAVAPPSALIASNTVAVPKSTTMTGAP